MIVHDMLQNKTHFKCSTFTVKRLSTMWETRVRPLGQEDPLEKEMAIHSGTFGAVPAPQSCIGSGPCSC